MNEYVKQANDFMVDSETTMTINRIGVVQGFPFDDKDKSPHVKYQVIMERKGKIYDFPFYDSTHNYQCGKSPTCYDVLACLEKYEPEPDVWDFANEYGYEINSKKSYERVSKIHESCVEQYEHLLDLFGEKWMEKLCEIN